MSLKIDTGVVFKSLNNCFISLPSSFIYPILNSTNLLVQQIVLHIYNAKTDQHIVTVGWNGLVTQNSNEIEIDTQYANILNIKEGSIVNVEIDLQIIKEISSGIKSFATSVEIEPLTVSDWELTEIYAQAIEYNFLSQVRCVMKNQQLLIRANPTSSGSSNSGSITFRVVKINSFNNEINFSLINNNTELFIIPKPHQNNDLQGHQSINSLRSNHDIKKRSVSSKKTTLKSDFIIKRSMINKNGSNLTVYNKGPKIAILNDMEFIQISVIEGPGTPKRARKVTPKEIEMGLNQNTFGKTIIARYVDLNDTTYNQFDQNNEVEEQSFMLSPLLAICLGIENTSGEIVCVEQYNRKTLRLDISNCELLIRKFTTTPDDEFNLNAENKLELKTKEKLNKKLKQLENNAEFIDDLKGALIKIFGHDTPLSNGLKIPILDKILPQGGILEIINKNKKSLNKSNIVPWVLLNSEKKSEHSIKKLADLLELRTGNDQFVPTYRIQEKVKDNINLNLFGQDKKLNEIKEYLSNYVPTFLYGKAGSGKTLICNVIDTEFKENGFYTKVIDFAYAGNINSNNPTDLEKISDESEDNEDLINKTNDEKVDNNKNKFLTSIFDNALEENIWHSPSLLILENLDKILPKEFEHSDNSASSQLSEILIKKFDKFVKEKKLAVLVTSKSRDSINQIIFQRHFVDEEVCLETPNKHQLLEILQQMLLKKFPEYTDSSVFNFLSDVTSELEGYLPLDLMNLLDRVFHNMVAKGNIKFEYSNFLSAIEGYTPTSLRGVKLQKSVTNWSDIGGLLEVKRIMLETLEWPTKYAPIFEKCTLRLRSGILLYGYPGCGKTMLASAISSQCGLNFISVKGPEILNKYIGASEQSVRELFERAQSAKPCILFFDEFDSIAPKRGHDSTGVTDRIVNQLLTQMDGAEGLDGVYVLAATSRPDLIDSALLRPGRLDKSVICDLPDLNNRFDILNTIVKSNGFNLCNEGDELIEIARLTEGYTGADLQAVVYNAYLKGVHESLEEKSLQESKNDSIISQKNDDLKYRFILPEGEDIRFKALGDSKKKIETVLDNYHVDKAKSPLNSVGVATKVREKILITSKHLKESLSETKKSISTKELEKLQYIYSQFESNKRPSEMKNGEGSTDVGVRATLM
jgi:peroxin-1